MTSTFRQRHRRRVTAAALAGGLLLSACGGGTTADTTAESASAPVADEPAEAPASAFPQFTAATVDGGQLDFGSLEGQDAVIWFWAPW